MTHNWEKQQLLLLEGCTVIRGNLKNLVEETGWKETLEVQQDKAQSPRTVEEQPPAPVPAGDWASGKQLGTKGPGGPGGHQVKCEPEMWPYGKGE